MATFDGHAIGWDFQDHLQHTDPRTGRPYRGGTDLVHKRGEKVKAYVSGKVTAVTRTSVTITPPSGNKTLILELGNVFVSVGDQVHPDTVIGSAGLKWPHYNDLLPAGLHVRAAFLSPPTQVKDDDMRMYHHAVGAGTVWAVGGAGVWFEIGTQASANNAAAAFGASTLLTQAQWDIAKNVCLSGAGSGGVYVDSEHLDDAEAESLSTSEANYINAHTTAAKDEVLLAISGLTLTAN